MESIERLVQMNDDGQAVPRRAETRRLTEESKRLDKFLSEAGFDVNSNLSIQEKLQLYRVVKNSRAEEEKRKSQASLHVVEPMEEDGMDSRGSAAGCSSTSNASSSASTSKSWKALKSVSEKKPGVSNGTNRSAESGQKDVVMGTPSKPRPVHRPAPTHRPPPLQPVVHLEDCRVGQVRTSIEHGAGPSRVQREIAMEVGQETWNRGHGKQPGDMAQPGPSSSAMSDAKTRKAPTSKAHLLHRPFDISLHRETGHVFIRCGVANGGLMEFGHHGKDGIVVDPLALSGQEMLTWLKARRYHELDTVIDVRRETVPDAIKSMCYWDPERLPPPCPFPPTYTERYGDKFPPGDMNAEEGAAVLFHCQAEFRERLGKCRIPHVIKNERLTLLPGGPLDVFERKSQKENKEEGEDGQTSVHDAGEEEQAVADRGSADEVQVLSPQPSTSGWQPREDKDDVQVLPSQPSTSGYQPKRKKEQTSPDNMDFESGEKELVHPEAPVDPNEVDEEEEEDEQQEPDDDDDSDWEQQTSRKKRGRRGGRKKGPKSPSKPNDKVSPTDPRSPGRPRKDAGKKRNNSGRQQQQQQQQQQENEKPSTSNQQSPRSKRLFHKYEIAAGTKKDLRNVAGRSADMVTCPLCGERFPATVIEGHAATCGDERK